MTRFQKRPWGWWATLFSAEKIKVKLLYFKKDKACSLQRHLLRDETWCFLFGTGVMWCNKTDAVINKHKLRAMFSGSGIVVPVEYWHQYYATKPTLVLEIQTGVCKEDDIERKE